MSWLGSVELSAGLLIVAAAGVLRRAAARSFLTVIVLGAPLILTGADLP